MRRTGVADARPVRRVPAARRGVGVGLGVWLTVFGALWALFGYGLADAARYPIAETYLLPDRYPANSTPPLLWALFTGAFAGGAVGSVLSGSLARRVGVGAASAAQSAVALVCIALGVLLGARAFWVTAPRTGTYVDAAGRSAGTWHAGAWIGWSSRYWAPGALALLAVVLVIAAVRSTRTARRRAARTDAVLATGTRADAVVTEVADTRVEIMGRPRIRYVVRFTDRPGVERLVSRTGTFDPLEVPRVGDPASVWFDPADPGDGSAPHVVLGPPRDADGTTPGVPATG